MTGKRVRVNSAAQANLAPKAICFYKLMPDRKLGVRDLMSYVVKSLVSIGFSIYCPYNAFRNAVLDADNIFAGHLFRRYVSTFRNFCIYDLCWNIGNASRNNENVSALCGAIVNVIFSVEFSAFISLICLRQIFVFAPALVTPALWIMTILFVSSVLLIIGHSWLLKQRMKLHAQEYGMLCAFVIGIQKIKLAGAERRAFAK